MKISMFHSKHDNSKSSRNKTNHEPISKLSRLFSKLNTMTHHQQHRYPYKHALARTSMNDLPPFTKSNPQVPMKNYDKDKVFEHRHYQGNAKERRSHTNDHIKDKSVYESEGIPRSFSNSLIHRPPLTTSPSLNEIARLQPCRPSHINSNRNIQPSSYDLTRHSAESTLSTDIISMISKCHDNDTTCDSRILSHDDNGEKNGNLTGPSHVKQQEKAHSRQLQIWDSAFWNESPSNLNRKISAPPPGRRVQQQQPLPPCLHELRRINTISNDDLDKRYRHHSLQRNHSYVVRKGRFEISIETSDTDNARKSATLGKH